MQLFCEQQVSDALFFLPGYLRAGDWKVFNEAACLLNIFKFKKKGEEEGGQVQSGPLEPTPT
jgi:hypothetical protein